MGLADEKSKTAQEQTSLTVSPPESHESAFGIAGAASTIGPDDPETAAPPLEQLHIHKPEGRLKRTLKSPKFWIGLVLILLALAVGVWFFRPTRIWVVTMLGLRVPLTVQTSTAPETGQPGATLQKVTVRVNGVQGETNQAGTLTTAVPYGSVVVQAEKAGYESAQTSDYYDFDPFFGLVGGQQNGTKQTLELQLKSTGISLAFKVVDWLTDEPITKGEFSVHDVVAKPDGDGVVSLKVPPTDDEAVKVSAAFNGAYTDREFEVALRAPSLQKVVFAPAGRNYFMSNRSGQLGLYSSYLDGSDVQQVVAPSANETAAADVAASPSGKYALFASTREAKRNSAGKLVQKLYVVNLSTKALTAVDEGLWFDFADWSGDTLAYTTSADAASQRLVSVDAAAAKKTDLANGNSFGVVRLSLGNAIYQLNHAATAPEAENNPELRTVPLKGGSEKNIGNKVSVVSQTDFDKLAYQTADKTWHEYNVNTSAVTNVSTPVSPARAYLAAASPDGQSRLFVDKVDGKNTIYIQNIADGKQRVLHGNANLHGPVRWVGSVVLFRVSDTAQAADYAVSSAGGTPRKIGDVTASSSLYSDSFFSFY